MIKSNPIKSFRHMPTLTYNRNLVSNWTIRLASVTSIIISSYSTASQAENDTISFSGFMSIVGGQVISGDRNADLVPGIHCPCFIADWNTFATYDETLNLNPESRVGLRMNANMSDDLTGVIQVDARNTDNSNGVTLEWAYINYESDEKFSAQVGRKRIPIYYYSDFMDVGFAYPWVRAPQDLYGWEVNNFNGLTLIYKDHWTKWNSRASIFYGQEDSNHNVMQSTYFYYTDTDVRWDNITGADLELTRDWLNIRLVFIQSDVKSTDHANNAVFAEGKQNIYGLSANADIGHWLIRSELSRFDRWQDIGYKSDAWMIATGYQLAEYTTMFTYSTFKDANTSGYPNWKTDDIALTLRYDMTASTAIKIQYDIYRELSTMNSTSGDAGILTISFDMIF